MESAYTLVNRELARRRLESQQELERREAELRRTAPEYARIEAKLRQCGLRLAMAVLNKDVGYQEIEAAIRQLQGEKQALLHKLGLPGDYLEQRHICPLCRDTGFDQQGGRCSCYRQLLAQYLCVSANLTQGMREQTFARWDFSLFANQPEENGRSPLACAKQAHAKGLQFAETFDETHANLLLMGNAGTGKTFLSSCIANYALARGKTVYYQTAFQLFDLLERLKFGRVSPEEQEDAETTARYLRQADLLIVDDLGAEFCTAYSAAALFDLVNTRLLQEKSTVLSTNLSAAGLEELYSKRFTSRVLGNYTVLRFVGQDLRLRRFQADQR